jgi:sugar phosphate isomerase/epimerase
VNRVLCYSYTYRAYPLERALAQAKQYGYDGLEISVVHYDPERPDETITEAKRAADRVGLPIPVIAGGGDLLAEDPQQRRDACDRIVAIIRAAAGIGAGIVNGMTGGLVGRAREDYGSNGSALATQEHYERVAEALVPVARTAHDLGLTYSLELHMNTIHDTAQAAMRLLDLVGSPALGVTYDPGNLFAIPTAEPPARVLKILGDRLKHVHLKNGRWLGGSYDWSWPLELGHIDYYQVLDDLKSADYAGDLSIEYVGLGDPSVPARRDVVYTRMLHRDVRGIVRGITTRAN